MSKLVDERVVEMRFDNSNFEKNTRQSMSTIQKLKSSLNFSGVSTSINKSVSNIDMTPITYGLEKASSSFSAWEVVAINVISRVTNYVIDLGEQLVKSLSIDNVRGGWELFAELTKNSGTMVSQLTSQLKDEAAAQKITNEYMDKYMWYAGATSYTLADMTNAATKFINKEKSMEETFSIVTGIANLAASAGKNAQDTIPVFESVAKIGDRVMSREWYTLQNKGLATADFTKKIMDAAAATGALEKNIDTLDNTVQYFTKKGTSVTLESFYESLSEGWLDSKIFFDTLGEYGSAVEKVYQLNQELQKIEDEAGSGKTITAFDALDIYTDKSDEAIQKAQELGYETMLVSNEVEEASAKWFDAAAEARTYTDAINAAKDAVRLGWTKIFTQLVGDYQKSVEVWSTFADKITDIFAAPVNAISSMIDKEDELNKQAGKQTIQELLFSQDGTRQGAIFNLVDAISKLVGTVRLAFSDVFKLKNGITGLAESFQSFTSMLIMTDETATNVRNIFRGFFAIFKLGTKILQGLRIAVDPTIKAITSDSGGVLKFMGDLGARFADWVDRTEIFIKAGTYVSNVLTRIINTLKELKIVSRIVDTVKDFFAEMEIGGYLAEAWKAILDTADSLLDLLLKAFKAVLSFTVKYVIPALAQIIKYLGVLIGIVAGILIKGVQLLFDSLRKFFEFIKGNESIQNAWKKFIEFLKSIPNRLKKLGPFFVRLGNAIANFFKAVWNALSTMGRAIAAAFKLKTLGELFALAGEKIAYGFHKVVDAIKSLVSPDATNAIDGAEQQLTPLQTFFKGLIDVFKGLWAIIKALLPFIGRVLSLIGALFQTIANTISNTFTNDVAPGGGLNLNLIDIIHGAIAVLLSKTLYDIFYLFKSITSGIYEMFSGIGSYLRAKAVRQWAIAMKDMAIAILMFVGALYLIASMDTADLIKATKVLVVIIGTLGIAVAIIAGFSKTYTKIMPREVKDPKSIKEAISSRISANREKSGIYGAAGMIIGMGMAVLLMAAALKIIASIKPAELQRSTDVLVKLILITAVSISLMNVMAQLANSSERGVIGIKGTVGFAISLLIMAAAITKLAKIDDGSLWKGISAITALGVAYGVMVYIMHGYKAKSVAKMAVFAAAMLALVEPIKLLGEIGDENPRKLWSGIGAISAIAVAYGVMSALASFTGIRAAASFLVILAGFGYVLQKIVELINTADMAEMSMSSLGKFGLIFAGLILGIELMLDQMKRITSKKGWKKTIGAFAVVLSVLIGALYAISYAVLIFEQISLGSVIMSLWMMAAMLTASFAVIILVKKLISSRADAFKNLVKKLAMFGIIFGALVLSMAGIGAALLIFEQISFGAMVMGLWSLAAMIAMTAAIIPITKKIIKTMNGMDNLKKKLRLMGEIFAILILGMAGIGAALLIFEQISFGAMVMGLWSLAALITASLAVLVLVKKLEIDKSITAGIVSFVAVMSIIASMTYIFGLMAKNLSGVDWPAIGKALTLMGTLLLGSIIAIALAAKFSSQISKAGDALLKISAAFAIFGVAAILFAEGAKMLQENVKGLLIFAGVIIAVGILMKIMSSMTTPMIIIAAAFALIGASALAMGGGIYLIVAALNELFPNLDELAAKSEEITTVISAVVEGVISGIAEAIPKIVEQLLVAGDMILQNIQKKLMGIFDWIKKLDISDIMDVVDKVAQLLFALIMKALTYLEEYIGPIIDKAINILITAIDTLTARIPDLLESLINFVIGLINGVGEAIDNNAVRIRQAVENFFWHLWSALLKLFGMKDENDTSTRSESLGGSIITSLLSGIKKLFSKVGSVMKDLVKKLWDGIKDLPKKFLEIGKNIIEGLWNGIKSVVSKVVEGIKNIGSMIKDGFCALFGIHSPSKVFYEYGEYMMQGLDNGLEDSKDSVQDSMQDIYDDTSEVFSDTDIYDQYGRKLNKTLAAAILANGGIMTAALNEILTRCVNSFDERKSDFNDAIKKIALILEGEFDEDNLVIRPVMDITDIENKTTLAAAMISSLNGVTVNTSSDIAERTSRDISTARSLREAEAMKLQTQSANVGENQNGEYNFTFNLYGVNDPKDLADKVNRIFQREISKRGGF